MTKKRILWIGCLESDAEFKIKSKKGYNLASAQVSQKNLLLGIEEETGITFDSINGSVVPNYPIYSDMFVKEVKWAHKENAVDISVGYANIKFINRLTCKYSMISAVRRWIKDRYNNEELIVYVYSMRSPVMAAACELKKNIPKAKIYLIVTDLPQFMDLGQSKIKAILKKIDWIQINKMKNKFDGFILYAEQMSKFLKIENRKWLLMEGLYDNNEIQLNNKSIIKKKAIMYSGKLDKEYGIELLLNAFMKISDSELELWLTGGGNSEKFIKECCKKDKRIKYYGFLTSRQAVIEKQNQAMALINMRLPSEVASAYCFPSKLFEYMATAIPVISFDIAGIPEEYKRHLILIEDENEGSIGRAIKSVLEMNSVIRDEIGKKAKDFILNEKSIKIQCNKIVKFTSYNETEDNNEEDIMGM